jgi:hypothetical protein
MYGGTPCTVMTQPLCGGHALMASFPKGPLCNHHETKKNKTEIASAANKSGMKNTRI